MNEVINEILASGEVRNEVGEVIPLHSAISKEEGELLFDTISSDSSVRKTLEVGCAYGVSSLYICEAIKGRTEGHHTMIDPFQKTQWAGVGIHNLKQAGFGNFELIEEKSEFGLPGLLKDGEERFHFVLIDGWHTFDHALVDCFYAARLLAVGGYLAVDDVDFPAVRRVIDYLLNYPCFEFFGASAYSRPRSLRRSVARTALSVVPSRFRPRIFNRSLLTRLDPGSQTMVILKKVSEDDRNWDWYSNGF